MPATKKTNATKKFTAKNAKARMTESAISPKKTIDIKTTKKATSKNVGVKKTRSKSNGFEVPAFLPKYPDYRLADIVATTKWRQDNVGGEYVEEWEDDGDGPVCIGTRYDDTEETLQDYIFRQFPRSIAAQYLKQTKSINDMKVLSNIVDEYVTSRNLRIPADDAMVMHLRVGDVIDGTKVPVHDFLNRRVDSWQALFGPDEPCTWSPVYVRCLASFDRALKKTEELGIHKISLVYGFHINHHTILKSKRYLASLVVYAQSKGFEVELITDQDADVSFAYACNAKHFIPGGGGFSKLMAKVVRQKGNAVHYVRV
jgi:hypothetical protein